MAVKHKNILKICINGGAQEVNFFFTTTKQYIIIPQLCEQRNNRKIYHYQLCRHNTYTRFKNSPISIMWT